MSAELRERLALAAGTAGEDPDVDAAMRRGTQMRRRRRLLAASAAVVVVALVAGGAALAGWTGDDSSAPSIADQPHADAITALEVFRRPAEQRDWVGSITTGGGLFERPGIERPTPRLAGPRFPTGSEGSNETPWVDVRQARLGFDGAEGLTVHLLPPIGDPVDTEGEPLEGAWVYVELTRGAFTLSSSAPVPAEGDAHWAGSLPIDGEPVAVVVVGDGLDMAHTATGTVEVQDNVVVVEGLGRGDSVRLSGPAGDVTVTIPAEGA